MSDTKCPARIAKGETDWDTCIKDAAPRHADHQAENGRTWRSGIFVVPRKSA